MKKFRPQYALQAVGLPCEAAYWAALLFLLVVADPLSGQSTNTPGNGRETPQAFEVGPSNVDMLPRGKEADGILGDFVLRNSRVELLISHNAPLRRANMSTFYGTNGITPGCLYDLTLRGADNDQIVIFSPLRQRGPVSSVRISRDGKDGIAEVETETAAVRNQGLFVRHAYQLNAGDQGLRIVSTLRNESKATRTVEVSDQWTQFARQGEMGSIRWADAQDPADKAGYASAFLPSADGTPLPETVPLEPGQELQIHRYLAVGRSPAEAAGIVAAQFGPVGTLRATLRDPSGKPILSGRIDLPWGTNAVPAYPDAAGVVEVLLPPGHYRCTARDMGRADGVEEVRIEAGKTQTLAFVLGPASGIAFEVEDAERNRIPCKVQFRGIEGTATPQLGPNLRAHGCIDQYHSETGGFSVGVPPGTYEITVTRGIEYTHVRRRIEVPVGQTVPFQAVLKRVVDTRGWVSVDYHSHSTESGDNTCGTPDRLINLVAEHIEFAPTTEHNRLFDWRPTLLRIGLEKEIQTVPGLELTGSGAHMNSFPFTPVPRVQDNGAPVWNRDPRITALTLRRWQGEDPHRWVQINHPDMVENFFDRDLDGQPDGGFVQLGGMIDAVETENYTSQDILGTAPFRIIRGTGRREQVEFNRAFLWLQLLNRGAQFRAMAVSDAHTVHGNGVGGWRMYLPSQSDAPAQIDWRENVAHAKAGRSILTTGPFLQVQLVDGTLPGGLSRGSRTNHLRVTVQCTDWIEIDRVQVLVNGRRVPALNFTRDTTPERFRDGVVRFEETLPIVLSQDAHIIVVAAGEKSDLSRGYGTSEQSKLRPCAYHNPIFIDVDGNGFQPNGDTLGFDLPAGGLTVEEARRILAREGQPTAAGGKTE